MRLDSYISEIKGISRTRAKVLIDEGSVTIDGKIIKKPSFQVEEDTHPVVTVDESTLPYVSRGGLKLAGALDSFEVDPTGKVCADIGASTGGFTDCLLRRGAEKVYAVDSGTDQLAEILKSDKRVISIEGFNARNLTDASFGEKCSLAACDLSFISQTYVMSGISSVLADGGEYIGLIKPQFECGRQAIGKGGIVKSPSDHLCAIERVIDSAVTCGFHVRSIIVSPIKGGDGNREFLFHAVKSAKGGCSLTDVELKKLVMVK